RRLDDLEELDTVDIAEFDVENQQIDDPLVEKPQRRGGIMRRQYAHALGLEREFDGAPNVLLVIEHENGGRAGRIAHSKPSRQGVAEMRITVTLAQVISPLWIS